MFSYVSVSQSVCPQGALCDHYSWCIGTHCTRPHTRPCPPPGHGTLEPLPPWDLKDPLPQLSPLDMGPQPWPHPLLVTSWGHHWRPVQTCSLQDPPWCIHLMAVEADTVSASGRYTSYWNAFLFKYAPVLCHENTIRIKIKSKE